MAGFTERALLASGMAGVGRALAVCVSDAAAGSYANADPNPGGADAYSDSDSYANADGHANDDTVTDSYYPARLVASSKCCAAGSLSPSPGRTPLPARS